MTGRLARFSCTFDCDPDGDVDVVLNADSDKGFTLTAVHAAWQSEDMSGSSDVPHLSITGFTGVASTGTAGVVFSHTDGDAAATAALLDPSTLGSSPVAGPQFWPGFATFTGSAWYLHGGQYLADFAGSEIYVAAGNSLRVRTTKLITATVHFYESLTP